MPYEAVGEQTDASDTRTPQQRRDAGQASNLIAGTFAQDPHAKVLVHAGFDHIREQERPNWSPMAWYLKQQTGVDPVTVDQVASTARSEPRFGHPVHQALAGTLPTESVVFVDRATGTPLGANTLAVDFVVTRAEPPLVDGRPAWMTLGGTRALTPVRVPECARRHCVVTVHHAAEPDSATVVDRVEIRGQAIATLFLPALPLRITVYDASGQRLRGWVTRDP